MDFLKTELVRANKNDMEELTGKLQTILNDFSKIPKINTEPTWMEICRYPQSRFEEVCSRVLAFYLNPNAEHEMKDLWLSALLSAIGKSDYYDYRHNIKVNIEESADGKRIDITIVSDDYVIAIENKITANLYNPLDIYKKHVSKVYPDKKQVLVVLSMKPILNTRSLTENGFLRCSYSDLFKEVNSSIGNYISSANQKYLTFMIDFMKTINNLNSANTQIEYDFFSKNRETIDELIKRYESYKAKIFSDQTEAIAQLKDTMNRLTGADWWAWQNWDLGVTFNEKSHRIGIEAHFEEEGGNPVARFNVCITTWRKDDWIPYKEAVLNDFADYNPIVDESCTGRNSNRVFVWIYCNTDGNLDAIVNKLKEIYDKLPRRTSNIH